MPLVDAYSYSLHLLIGLPCDIHKIPEDTQKVFLPRMTQPIDYSKWENIEESDSEDVAPPISSVRLSAPSTVHIGPCGASLVNPVEPPQPSSPFGKEFKPLENAPVETRDDDEILYECLSKNGGKEGDSHIWSQTDDSVTISFPIPLNIRAKDIFGFRIHEVEIVRGGVILQRPQIEFSYKISDETVTVVKEFYYPLKLDEDLLNGCWELKTINNQRFLIVQVFKMLVAIGVVVWWDRCFSTDTNLCNTNTIQSRKGTQGANFQQVWEEAHDLFKQRIAERRARGKA